FFMYSIIHLGNNNREVIISMILTMHNQLTLLHDLLDEQLLYKSVTEAEYKRIKALVRSIMAHQHNGEIGRASCRKEQRQQRNTRSKRDWSSDVCSSDLSSCIVSYILATITER